MKNVSAILCSDIHLRIDQPVCRLDNFKEAFAKKLKWVSDLQQQHNCPVLCGGDLFNHWKPSPELLVFALRNLPDEIITIPGQHDLPAHNLEDIEKSGIQVLSESGKIKLLTEPDLYGIDDVGICGFPWGCQIGKITPFYSSNVAIIHYGVYESKPHYPGAENSGGTAKSIIKKMPGFDLILSGDNHLTFTCKVGEQVLVNPGSFMRTTAAQAEHKPSVFLWCAETNEVEQVFVPIEKDVISRDHIDVIQERDERLEAFVERLDHNVEMLIVFKTNMRNYLVKNKDSISKPIQDIIRECMP